MSREKIEFSSTTPSFIKKLLESPVQKPVPKKEPVDDGPVIVNETQEAISQVPRENKIIEIGAQKLKKQIKSKNSNSKNTLDISTTSGYQSGGRSGRLSGSKIEKTRKSIKLLSFSDQEE